MRSERKIERKGRGTKYGNETKQEEKREEQIRAEGMRKEQSYLEERRVKQGMKQTERRGKDRLEQGG